jgi:methyl-accepting chemotaxis protein
MANHNQPRRQWIVNPRFQVQFAVILVILHINVGFLYQVVLHYRMRALAEDAGSLQGFLDIEPWTSIWPAMALSAVVSGVIVFLVGIRYSNQIVGPLPRISRTLQELAKGNNPSRLTFRPGDVLEQLAGDVNELADSMHPSARPQQDSTPAAEEQVNPASIVGQPVDRQPVNS